MARGIRPLADDELLFAVQPAEFSPLVAETLGDNLTDADGFEQLLSDAALNLNAETNELDGLVSDLLDANFIPGEFEQASVSPMLADHVAFVTSGDALLSDMADAIADDPSQQPPQGDGGGGQGGGGGEGGGGGCDGNLFNCPGLLPPVRPGPPQHIPPLSA